MPKAIHAFLRFFTIVVCFSGNAFAESASVDEAFLRLAGIKKIVKTRPAQKHWQRKRQIFYRLKNAAPFRDFQTDSANEYFLRHQELYKGDLDYASAFPTFEEYFAKREGREPRKSNAVARVLTQEGDSFLKGDLNVDRLYRAEYLLASKGDSFTSGFGHSMLRLVFCDPDRFAKDPTFSPGPECLDDHNFHLVVSFRAKINDLSINSLKGFFGGYNSRLFFMPFNEIKNEYNLDEFRDLLAYELKLEPKQKKRLVWPTLELYWTYQGEYKFVTNNCADETLSLIKSALWDSPLELSDRTTPYGVLDELQDAGLIEDRPLVFKSRKSDYESYLKTIGQVAPSAPHDLESYMKLDPFQRSVLIQEIKKAFDTEAVTKREALKTAASAILLEKLAKKKREQKAREELPSLVRKGIVSEEDAAPVRDFNEITDNFNLATNDSFGIPSREQFRPVENFLERLDQVNEEFNELKAQMTRFIPDLESDLSASEENLRALKEIKNRFRRK